MFKRLFLFFAIGALCLSLETNAQQYAIPFGGNFTSQATGNQLGHLQSSSISTFGSVTGNGKWIGLGLPNVGPAAYGMRIQDFSRFCTLDIRSGKSEIFWGGTATNDFTFNYSANGTNPTPYMTIKSNGRVGIGKTNPNHDLDVAGTIETDYLYPGFGDGTPYRFIRFGDPSNFWAGFMWNNNSNAYGDGDDFTIFTYDNRDLVLRSGSGDVVLTPNSSGKVAVGTTNPGNFKFYVNGQAFSTVNWSGSDKRYKKDIKNIDSALEKVKSLEGMTYKFKRETINNLDLSKVKEGNHLGFIAQDLEKVFPELVQKDDAGFYAVNYNGLIPVLVEAVKDQDEIVETQKETISGQAKQLDEQETTIAKQATTITEQTEQIATLNNRMNRLETLLNDLIAAQSQKQEVQEMPIRNTAVLEQNIPNPSSGETSIKYELPSNTNAASLVIYDLGGKEMQTFPISGKGNVTFNTSTLENGTYVYAIIANGESIARQRMIVQR